MYAFFTTASSSIVFADYIMFESNFVFVISDS